MRKFRSKLTAAMIILVVVTSFLSVLFAILTVNGKFLERPEMRHVMFGLAAGDVILLIILITMIAIGFILVMRSIMKPILELDKAVSKVTAGDYNVKVDTYNKAEAIVDLLDNFNTMVEQLRNNEYLHKDFSSNISHEFKTPLAIIKGYADLLEEGDLTEEEQRNYAQYISRESKRLSTLTANLLSLSSLDYDKLHGRKTAISIDEQIRQAVLNMEAKWLEKNIDIDLELNEVYFTGEE
ncbi:MAG: HAMP domain-containing histidine kinase, partial [Firmicutes bacterium]|nr:HAMP domain-containing histidine kinase [Bacillota bacterium]